MSKIGIGIVTYNRLEYLKRSIEAVRRFTVSEYELVVADDGSTDGTVEWCKEQGIRVVSGANGGVCWNKNRALFAMQELGCDPILLLEDDCVPIRSDWDWDWRIATALYGHVAFAHPKLMPWLISGAGTPVDPYVNNKATAQCSSASGLALSLVGFFDTRFKGYGVGHAEWTTRMKRVGYGFRKAIDKEGREVKANLYIEGGLVGDDAPTFKDKANVARNERLFDELKKEPPYRHPWSTDEERERFLAEQKRAGIGSARYQALNASEEDRDNRLNARHLRPYNKAYRRAFSEPGGFLRVSGWMSSVALALPIYRNEVVPGFSYPATELLQERIDGANVLAFGAGISAIWWSRRAASVALIEPDELVRTRLASIWPADGADLTFVTVENALAATGRYDVIAFQNGEYRDCIGASATTLTDSGVLIIAGSESRDCREPIAAVVKAGFKHLPLRGPTPSLIAPDTTSILYRVDNRLAI